MRKISVLLALIIILGTAKKSVGQNASIDGSTAVSQFATEYYEAHFQDLYWLSTITWNVTGGTILQMGINPSSTIYCIVQWEIPGTGSISVSEDLYSQFAELFVQVGSPTISPEWQTINYGAASSICADFGSAPVNSYSWEESIDGNTWATISSASSQCYQATGTQNMYYRCLLELSTGSFYTPAAWVEIAPFDPGIIFASDLIPWFNTSISITNTPASGGFCLSSSYEYSWEQSYEGNPWTVIGTTHHPVSSLLADGKMLIRRKVTCSGVSLYSNTLTIDPQFTPGDFENRNYVREITVAKRGIQNYFQADQLPVGDKFQSTTYLDGLGRSIQSVDKQITPGVNNTWNDLVKHFEYDPTGRTIKNFLGYPTTEFAGKFKTNAASVQPTIIRNFFNEPSTAPTYGLIEYDNSPLNRVIKSTGPGQSWIGSGISNSFDKIYNDVNEKVHIWNLDYSSNAIPVTSAVLTYSTGKLSKQTTIDEHGNKIINYTDFSGNIILKKVQEAETANLSLEHSGWVCTYYVYDDFGMVRFIITPKAVQYLDNNGWNLTQGIIDELCYKYLYDSKGRLIEKKKPGTGIEYMVYDKKDRLVLSQDANQKIKTQWLFSLYDELNRTIATGMFENSADRESMQTYVNIQPDAVVTVSAFVGNGNYQTISVDNPVAGSTGTSNYCNGCSNITFNSVSHYDNYGYVGVKSFNSSNTLAFSSSTDPQIEATVKTDRVTSLTTGEKFRVVDADNNPLNDKFLFSTAYYDEQGRSLQNLTDNIKNGSDYQTNQYKFSENLVSSFVSHSNGTETFIVTSKLEYDVTGRLTKLYKNFNNTFYKQLVEYSYDALGQVKTKRLAPGYTGTGANEIESIAYDYNIRGWLTGINKDYALSTDNFSQWNKFFGIHLGYDNASNFFAASKLNGNITGAIWKSQGDNSPRKYDYTYDRLDRFTSAIFKQKKKPSDSWSNTEVDLSAYIEYEDNHGNIKTMKQYGVIPGINNGVIVDMLNYSYNSISGTNNLKGNKLIKVDDIGHGLGSKNGILGDFKEAVTVTEEYIYDDNGNLVKDLNKNIVNGTQNGVVYNFMNKPEKIIIPGKSTIEFTYDASGEKISKTVTPATGPAKTTYYISDFIYEENILQFVLHEEGRLKIITPHTKAANIDFDLNAGSAGITWSSEKQGVFEYFLKDHLGSTRMVLTEEVQKEYYLATMESNVADPEEKLFGKVDATTGNPAADNEISNTRLLNNCGTTPWPGNCTNLSKLTAAVSTQKRGPNMILKVMAGDIISAKSDYYYLNNNSSGPGGDPLNDILTSLIGAITSSGKANDLSKAQSGDINNSLLNNAPFQNLINGQNTTPNSQPKAYLNVIFLDEQFKYVEADINSPDVGGGSLGVYQPNDPSAFLYMQKKAPKNGWVFVYLSNQSNEPVYFDNFNVAQEHSRIAEESHYYPYGLKIAGISSKAFNKLENKYGYQGESSEEEAETGWDEFFLRMYDPQLGRWTGIDPYDEFPSPYLGMGGDPINLSDESGGSVSDPGWLYNNLTDSYEWFDEINTLEQFANSSVDKAIYSFDELAQGGFVRDFAGKPYIFHKNGILEAYASSTLEMVTVTTSSIPKNLFADPNLKCHITNLDVQISQANWWYNLTKGLNRNNGQILPPRSGLIDGIFGKRTVDIADYPELSEQLERTNLNSKSSKLFDGEYFVGADGYLTNVPVQSIKGGTIPLVGGIRGNPIPSLQLRAIQLSQKIGKNSITIKTTKGHIRFDLMGRAHGHVPTPHKLTYTRNFGPNGKINFSKPKFPDPMTNADLRLIRQFLKSR